MPSFIHTESDLDAALEALGKADARFTALLAKAGRPPLRRRADGFAGLAAIIVAQQLSTASANAIWGRLAAAFDPLEPAAILRARPAKLARLGLSAPKIRALKAIAKAVGARGTAAARSCGARGRGCARGAHRRARHRTLDRRYLSACPASDTPMPGRPAISPCRRPRASPSRCRFGRTRRRCRRWRSRGGHGARRCAHPVELLPAWRGRRGRRKAPRASSRAPRAPAKRRVSLQDRNAAPSAVRKRTKVRATTERRRADVDHRCAGLTERAAALFFDCRRPSQMWKTISTGSDKTCRNVHVARPWAQRLGAQIVEAERSQDQHARCKRP